MKIEFLWNIWTLYLKEKISVLAAYACEKISVFYELWSHVNTHCKKKKKKTEIRKILFISSNLYLIFRFQILKRKKKKQISNLSFLNKLEYLLFVLNFDLFIFLSFFIFCIFFYNIIEMSIHLLFRRRTYENMKISTKI